MSGPNAERRRRRNLRRGAAAGVVPVAATVFLSLTASPADAADPAFNGAASATGVQITENLPGFIGTATPFDGGGPTAQAVLNSFTGGRGYATFPDPGGFLPTLPGLGAGLFSAGAGGLPPIPVPFEVPPYPLAASSDPSNPEQEIGSGPYKLTATTDGTSSQGFASAGFQPAGVGNVALLTSKAAVIRAPSGTVVASSSVVIQNLAVGPIVFGEIRSTAMQTMDATGMITPRTSMQLSGVTVGGVPVGLSDTGFTGMPGQGPQQLNDAFAQFLEGSGNTVTVVAAEKAPNTVIAPAIRISGPFEIPGVTTGPGTYTMNIGAASATLQGGGSAAAPVGAETSPGSIDGAAVPGTLPAALPNAVPGSIDLATGLPPTGVDAGTAPVPTQEFVPAAAGAPFAPESFDINSLYLMVVFGAAVALTSVVIIRTWGEGTP